MSSVLLVPRSQFLGAFWPPRARRQTCLVRDNLSRSGARVLRRFEDFVIPVERRRQGTLCKSGNFSIDSSLIGRKLRRVKKKTFRRQPLHFAPRTTCRQASGVPAWATPTRRATPCGHRPRAHCARAARERAASKRLVPGLAQRHDSSSLASLHFVAATRPPAHLRLVATLGNTHCVHQPCKRRCYGTPRASPAAREPDLCVPWGQRRFSKHGSRLAQLFFSPVFFVVSLDSPTIAPVPPPFHGPSRCRVRSHN